MKAIAALIRVIVCVAATAAALPASALVTTTMLGHVNNVSGLSDSNVHAGDTFKLEFTFDEAASSTFLTTSGGRVYTVVRDSFWSTTHGWTGSLADFIASRFGVSSQWVVKDSWFRPVGTLHHEEWTSGFGLLMITNYMASSGESYGWYGYGSPENIAFTIDSVVAVAVPEPSGAALALAGLGLLAAVSYRRRQTRHL